VVNAFVDGSLINVAPQGKTWGVSTPYSAQARGDNAIDGVQAARNYPSIYHSQGRTTDGWGLDLGKEYNVAQVIYYNRLDCCSDRAIGMTIRLWDKDFKIVKNFTLTGALEQKFNVVQQGSTTIAPPAAPSAPPAAPSAPPAAPTVPKRTGTIYTGSTWSEQCMTGPSSSNSGGQVLLSGCESGRSSNAKHVFVYNKDRTISAPYIIGSQDEMCLDLNGNVIITSKCGPNSQKWYYNTNNSYISSRTIMPADRMSMCIDVESGYGDSGLFITDCNSNRDNQRWTISGYQT
jgi:hypothetical protein